MQQIKLRNIYLKINIEAYFGAFFFSVVDKCL